MSLDETLLTLVWRLYRSCRRPSRKTVVPEHAVALTQVRTHLTLIARTLSGEPLDVQEAEDTGGYAGDILYLPRRMEFADTRQDNALAYVYRIAYTVTSRQLGLNWSGQQAGTSPMQVLGTLLAVPATLRALEAVFPLTCMLRARWFPQLLVRRPPWPCLDTVTGCLEALTQLLLDRPRPPTDASAGGAWLTHCMATAAQDWQETNVQRLYEALQRCVGKAASAVPPVPLWGQLLLASHDRQDGLTEPGERHTREALPSGRELPSPPKEYVRRVELDRRDLENDVLLHTFDKLETAEEFQGVTRTPDGADELAEHAEALAELDLRDVVRSAERTQSLYRADIPLEGGAGELADPTPPAAAVFLYDEWDGKARQYKPRWCTVEVHPAPTPPPQAAVTAAQILHKHRRLRCELRRMLDRVRWRRVLKNRQTDGAEIDLEAVVDRYATVRSGHQPDDRLYAARRRSTRDLVTLLLIDLSYSTDAWMQGRRVLDIAKESLLVLGDVLAQWQDRVGVVGFYSHTRRHCSMVMLKHFDEPWPRCTARLVALEPTGYTRIGPALRHGTALLLRQTAAKKLLLLLSDGKPTDYDRYEGRYGIADVRQAIREAQQARIHTYALAIERQAKLYLPHMFGNGNFQILSQPTHLVRGLTDLYRRLAH